MATRSWFCVLAVSALTVAGARDASAQVLPIDDFRTGAGGMRLDAVGVQQATQSGGTILGGTRCTVLYVTGNPLGRPVTTEVREGRDGYLAVDTGVKVDHAMVLLYGYDSDCNGTGLNLDLTFYDRFRLEFEAVDLGTAGAVVVFTDTGAASFPLSVPEGLQVRVDAPFDQFTGLIEWSRVQQIAIVIQSGGVVAAHDYAIRSVSAVLEDR